jgi:hypothetical protein
VWFHNLADYPGLKVVEKSEEKIQKQEAKQNNGTNTSK